MVLRHSALTCYPAFHNFRPAVLQNLLYFFYPSIWNMEYVEHFSVSYCSFKKRFNSTTAILTRGEPIRLGVTQYLVEHCISSSFRTVKKCITYLCKSKKERITVQTCLHGEGDVVVGGKTTLFNCLFRSAITQDQIFVNYLLYMESHSGGEL